MQSTVLFKAVYDAITSGEAFDASIVSCDRKRGTGGKLLRLEGWMICGAGHGGQGANEPDKETAASAECLRNAPNHDEHGTVNVFNPANSEVRPKTIHWDLIRIFNGKRVIN